MSHDLEPYLLHPDEETRDPASRRALQGAALGACVERARAGSPFWRQRLADAEVTGVTRVDEVGRLPFTTKADLRASYPFGALAVPRASVRRALTSSGTTGRPTVAAYTAADLVLWAELVARGLAAAGVRAGTTVHVAYGYGLFTGGPGFQAAAERLGALVIPAGSTDDARHASLLRDFGAAVLACTPSFAATLLEHLGDGARELPVTVGVFGGEPMGPGMRARLEAGYGLRVFEAYGLSELLGPGVAFGCHAGALHLSEDHFLPEIVEPGDGRALPDGELGELVLTALTREAIPLLRYRTGDLTRLLRGPCPCGRTLARLAPVRGRVEDDLVLDGRTLVPLDLEDVVFADPDLAPLFELGRRGGERVLRVEALAGVADEVAARTAARVRERLGVSLPVEVVARGTLTRSRGKARRVVET